MTVSDLKKRRSEAIRILYRLYPPSIQSAVLSRQTLVEKYDIDINTKISFGDVGLDFSRSELFVSVRDALKEPDITVKIADSQDREWEIEILEPDTGKFALCRSQNRLIVRDFWMLLPPSSKRLEMLEKDAKKLNLPEEVTEIWQRHLVEGDLDDNEVGELIDELRQTPINAMGQIESEFEKEDVDIGMLVMPSKLYFYRLAGECEKSYNLQEYLEKVAENHITGLLNWSPVEGLKLALLLSSHSKITSLIDTRKLNAKSLEEVFKFLCESGDRFSQLGAIEIGLSILDQHPYLEAPIIGMIEQIRDDDTKEEKSKFVLLSSLIILVDGEISRLKLFTDKPPFWRRLAAIAQASLIERCIGTKSVEVGTFVSSVSQVRGHQFYFQTLCDLRTEPKWMPDFISPVQLKAEFVGRIVNVGHEHSDKIVSSKLKDLLLEDGEGGLRHHVHFPYPFLPGPLEGATILPQSIPEEIANTISEDLDSETIEATSFIALINSALVFRLDDKFADHAAAALRRVRHYVRQGSDGSSVFSLVSGLAAVAAVTRNKGLADELRILIRRFSQVGKKEFQVEDMVRIGMVAAASRTDLTEWCDYVGNIITEIAFQEISKEQARRLHSHIIMMCEIVPELWTNLGKAEAALSSVID